jgi:hypothetical protein
MQSDMSRHDADRCPADGRPIPGKGWNLTPTQFLHLGLDRVGYIVAIASASRGIEVIIFGADGEAVVRADSVEVAVDLAHELGLVLVPVQ